jgi:hypothetical protein
VLDHVPLRIKKQLLQIIGETPEAGEPKLHGFRRIRMQMAEEKEKQKEFDPNNPKMSVEGVRLAPR